MPEDRKLPTPPPRGMILIDGKWQIRRHGLIDLHSLTCIFGHRIRPDVVPFEIAFRCLRAESEAGKSRRSDFARCVAELYVLAMRDRHYWAMDITAAESLMMTQYSIGLAEMCRHFGVGFPVDMKILRNRPD